MGILSRQRPVASQLHGRRDRRRATEACGGGASTEAVAKYGGSPARFGWPLAGVGAIGGVFRRGTAGGVHGDALDLHDVGAGGIGSATTKCSRPQCEQASAESRSMRLKNSTTAGTGWGACRATRAAASRACLCAGPTSPRWQMRLKPGGSTWVRKRPMNSAPDRRTVRLPPSA